MSTSLDLIQKVKIKRLKYWVGWIGTQLKNHKKKSKIMKDEAIRLKWEEFVNDARYKEYFMSDEDAWYDTLSKVKAYMDEHKSRPSSTQ